jgi:hypothetical protein
METEQVSETLDFNSIMSLIAQKDFNAFVIHYDSILHSFTLKMKTARFSEMV